jgi:23S rRNA (cytosine1962-C5)-methyltransferase
VNAKRDAQAIEAWAKIGSTGWDADRDAFHLELVTNTSVIPSGVEESLTVSETFRDVSTSVDMTKAIAKNEWISRPLLRAFEGEGTTAHRLCTIDNGWAERFGRDILISFRTTAARDRLVHELNAWSKPVEFPIGRVFARFLPKKNEERETPKLLIGNEGGNLQAVATEQSLKFGIDFGAGYSVGLFVDQRENRRFVRQSKPKRLLNCFAYTCSFSVAAASAGAQTVNVDLSKKSLERGRQNFVLNSLSTEGHQFISDDVRPVLGRLARRGEKFDMIILDPPTFSRTKGGDAFHVESDFEGLIVSALDLIEGNARILLSTNCETLNEQALERMARYCLKLSRKSGALHRQPSPVDFPPGAGAATIWLTLR